MKFTSAVLTSSLVVLAQVSVAQTPAQAAPPKVSGKYALMGSGNCQAKFTTLSRHYKLAGSGNGPAVWEISPDYLGEIAVEAGYITFTPSAAGSTSGTFAGSTTSIRGSALAIDTSGSPMVQQNGETFSGAYSATSTTFTLGGDVFVMTFGNVAGGVARQINLVRRDNARCAVVLSFTK